MTALAIRRFSRLIETGAAALALFAILSLASLSTSARADEAVPSWHVTQVSGTARLREGSNGWQPIAVGAAVLPGMTIETGADARVVLASNKDIVTVAPSSRLAVPAAKTGRKGANFLQTLGTILFDIEHNPKRHFEVDTPYLAAVVKGTAFSVTVRPDGGAVQVVRGAVQVASLLSPDIALVRPGEIARVPVQHGSRMMITLHGHTSFAPRGKTKAELTEPDPAPSGQKAKDGGQAKNAASGKIRGTQQPEGTSRAAPQAVLHATAGSHVPLSGTGDTLALDHTLSLPTKGDRGDVFVITKALGAQKIDIKEATGGFVTASAPASPPSAVGGTFDGNGSSNSNAGGNGNGNGNGSVNANANAAVATTPVATGSSTVAASPSVGNPGNGGTPAGQAVGNPHVSATVSTPVITTVSVSTPTATVPDTPTVSTPAVSTPAVTLPTGTVPGNGVAVGIANGHGKALGHSK